MDYIYKNKYVYFEKTGSGNPIILLHGWAASSTIFESITNILKTKYTIYVIDLPGFGKSEEPDKPYNLDDYVDLLYQFIIDLDIYNPILLGHSFGGRIAIKFASLYNVSKLILVDSAGLKQKNFIKTKTKILLYKLKKKYYKITKNVIKYNDLLINSGSTDYKEASVIMKKILVNVTNEYLDKHLKDITCDTLIIWGKKDDVTPYYNAIKLKKKIKNAGLVTLKGVGHFPFIESKKTFNKILKSYLEV